MRALLVIAVAGCWTHAEPPAPVKPPRDPAKPAEMAALPRQSADALITVTQVREVTGYADELEIGKSPAPMTDTYDDIHFKAIGKTERYDFMLRVWTLGPAGARKKLDELMSELPTVKPLRLLGDRAFTASEPDIYGVGFLDKRGAVVLVTCGMGQCSSIDQVIELARGAAANIH
jgi:hypothetical protein